MSRQKLTGIAAAFGMLALLALPFGPASASGVLNGSQIKSAVTGKRIYLSVPLGGEFPLHYKSNGRVDGSGEALGLGKYLRPTDSGRWWVAGNSLCQKWQNWYEGKRFCFTLERVGAKKLRWRRDDGKSGVARIGS